MSSTSCDPGDVEIRPAMIADLDAMYEICVRTGASGADATGMYRYPRLLGDVFVGPYVELQPEFAFVADRGAGPEGYVLGALDTAAFDRACERDWWPGRRIDYSDVEVPDDSRDAWLLRWIQSPPVTPGFVDTYPSHLHIDLLPSLQGGGWGRALMTTLWNTLRAHGSRGVHLGVGRDNTNGIGFYRHLGFHEIQDDGSTCWMGIGFS